jgi:hypothetical protein
VIILAGTNKKIEPAKIEKIKREIARLNGIFKDLDKNKQQVVKRLIESAAFMSVSLKELEDYINEKGYTVEYKNGENQFGTKQSDEVKIYISMSRNQSTILKTLADLAPPERNKVSKLQALRDE